MKRCSFSIKIPSNVFVEMPKSNQFLIFSRQHIRIWFYTCPYRGQLKIQSNISMLLSIVQNPIQCVGKSISLICIFEFGRFLCVCCAIPSVPNPSPYLLLCGETGLHFGLPFHHLWTGQDHFHSYLGFVYSHWLECGEWGENVLVYQRGCWLDPVYIKSRFKHCLYQISCFSPSLWPHSNIMGKNLCLHFLNRNQLYLDSAAKVPVQLFRCSCICFTSMCASTEILRFFICTRSIASLDVFALDMCLFCARHENLIGQHFLGIEEEN